MLLEFRRAVLPEEALDLWKLDVAIFGKDAFAPEDWLSLESYWIVADGQVAGCAAFIRDVEFQEDLREDERNAARPGTVYIQSTGLLPIRTTPGYYEDGEATVVMELVLA